MTPKQNQIHLRPVYEPDFSPMNFLKSSEMWPKSWQIFIKRLKRTSVEADIWHGENKDQANKIKLAPNSDFY